LYFLFSEYLRKKGKPGPDLIQKSDPDPNPHQSEKPGALKAHREPWRLILEPWRLAIEPWRLMKP
jgi:hypothetical protein